MRVASIDGRATVVTTDGLGVDVHARSGGEFSADPQAMYSDWPSLVAWASGLSADDFTPIAGTYVLPVPQPRQVFAIGANYRAHAAEANVAPPEQPVVFTKFPSCLTGPYDSIVALTDRVDWEIELVVVIGTECRDVAPEAAWGHVAGLTVGQDLSERALQRLGPMPQFSLAKSLRGFGPIGPVVVSIDEFDDPDDLALGCALNGEQVQSSRTSDLIFPVPDLIAYISTYCTLLPGDLIFTGTPQGVGATRRPPRFLGAGDVLTSWVAEIGEMRHEIVANYPTESTTTLEKL